MSFLFGSSTDGDPTVARLSPVKSNIEEANKHIQALCERVALLEAEKDAALEQLQHRDAEFESLRQTLDRCQEKLSHREVHTKNLELTAASREEIILELESHLVAHQRELNVKCDALTALETLVAEKEAVFERISSKVAEYQRVLEVKNQLLEAATKKAAELEKAAQTWKTDEEALKGECHRVAEENARLKKAGEENRRSSVALGQILTYSASIEGLAGMLKAAATLTDETEDTFEENDEKKTVKILNSPPQIILNGTHLENGLLEDTSDEECDDEVKKINVKEKEEVEEEDDERESTVELKAGEERILDSPNDQCADVDSEIRNGQVMATTSMVLVQEPSEKDHEPDDAVIIPSVIPGDSHVLLRNEEETVQEPDQLPNEAPSRVATRKSGEDRIASILLFDSAEVSTVEESAVCDGDLAHGIDEDHEVVEDVESVEEPSMNDENIKNGLIQNGYDSFDEHPPSRSEPVPHSTEFFV